MSVTAAEGFSAAGVTAGLKSTGRDLALVVNSGPAGRLPQSSPPTASLPPRAVV